MLQMFAHPAEFNFPHHHPRRQQQQQQEQQLQQQQQQQQQQHWPAQGSSSSPFSTSPAASPTLHTTCKKRPLCFEPEFLAALDSSLAETATPTTAAAAAAAAAPTATPSSSTANSPSSRPVKKAKKNGTTLTSSASAVPPNEATVPRQHRFTSAQDTRRTATTNTTSSTTATTGGSTHTRKHKDTRPPTVGLSDPLPKRTRNLSKSGGVVGGVSPSPNSAVTGLGSAVSRSIPSPSSTSARAGPSIIDLSSGEELVALHLGENEHKRRRDSFCSVSGHGHDEDDHDDHHHQQQHRYNNHSAESLREVFDVQDDGTLLPVWDHAPAMPSQKKKVKLDGQGASPLRSIDNEDADDDQGLRWSSGGGGTEWRDKEEEKEEAILGRDSTVFGSKSGGYFRRFSSTAAHNISPSFDASGAYPRHMDMGSYRDGPTSSGHYNTWRHRRPDQSSYHAEQDGWLGDDETSHHTKGRPNNSYHTETSTGTQKVDDRWALVKHPCARISLVTGVDELLKPRPASCMGSSSSSSSSGPQQQLVLYRPLPVQAYAHARIEELEDDNKSSRTGAIIEELDEDDEGALADDERTSPRLSTRVHELDVDEDLDMEAEDRPTPALPDSTNLDNAVLGIEEQIMSMDLD